MTLNKYLPKNISAKLFGNREKYGLKANLQDPDWLLWESMMEPLYNQTQCQGAGRFINNSGYKIMQKITLKDKSVLELGPGNISHHRYWKCCPKHLYLVDRRKDFLKTSAIETLCKNTEVDFLENNSYKIPLNSNEIDILISFYSLEHLLPLEKYIEEFLRLLKPGGLLVGAIPTEGGLAWGMGRFLTTRRAFKKQGIDLDKIICWEHPNFAEEIIETLKKKFKILELDFWPLKVPSIDMNLTISFICQKKKEG
jgi:SAM-dependent methyltransferase